MRAAGEWTTTSPVDLTRSYFPDSTRKVLALDKVGRPLIVDYDSESHTWSEGGVPVDVWFWADIRLPQLFS